VTEQAKIFPSDLIYFTEDDYLHRVGWGDLMREALCDLKASYCTGYNHPDKFCLNSYKPDTQLFVTRSSHWRTAPSTTNTYACLYSTLLKDIEVHKKHCDLVRGFTNDHNKFLELWSRQSSLVTAVPGFSTHCEQNCLAPCVDWAAIQYETVPKQFSVEALKLRF
jgi:hypothetical protein